jgi:hypothetical protein
VNKVVAGSMILIGVAVFAFGAPPFCRSQISGQVVRVIDDGANGDRWLLVRDATNSGGPGRMVRLASAAAGSMIRPVIHAGDALVVEEHTAVVDARLEATALGSAVIGAVFQARLKIGGEAVRVVALGPGRADLMPEAKGQP